MGILDDFEDMDRPARRRPASFDMQRTSRSSVGGTPCPTCGSRNNEVVDSRPIPEGQRRRRRCLASTKCERWNTYETTISPETYKSLHVSFLDQNRIKKIVEMATALKKSFNIKD